MGKEKSCAHVENIIRFDKCSCKKPKPKVERVRHFPKETIYSGKVLLGNWFEDTCSYKKNKHVHNSEYLSEYVPKPNTTLPRSIIWDAIMQSQGHDIISGNYIDQFKQNYMTSYYLSYNLLPELAKHNEKTFNSKRVSVSKMPKHDEQFENYGNQENYGLADYMKSTWKCDRNNPRSTADSIFEATYAEPPKESYEFRRWGRRRPKKGKYGDEYTLLPPNHPRLAGCNPLTWESKDVSAHS